jgi:hypothetical protein
VKHDCGRKAAADVQSRRKHAGVTAARQALDEPGSSAAFIGAELSTIAFGTELTEVSSPGSSRWRPAEEPVTTIRSGSMPSSVACRRVQRTADLAFAIFSIGVVPWRQRSQYSNEIPTKPQPRFRPVASARNLVVNAHQVIPDGGSLLSSLCGDLVPQTLRVKTSPRTSLYIVPLELSAHPSASCMLISVRSNSDTACSGPPFLALKITTGS